jgi:hypothetical protein
MVLVRATTTTDWQALREIRLQALLDAPDAFASTHAGEAAFGEDEWRRRAGRDGSFIAFLPEVCPAGLGGGYLAAPEVVELVACSSGRRPGAAASVRRSSTRSRRGPGQQGASTVHLWVTETNPRARLLYERCGFTVTAERQPLPSNPALSEIGMQRPV